MVGVELKRCGLCGELVSEARWIAAQAAPGRGACLLCLVEARARLRVPGDVVPFREKTGTPKKSTPAA